MSILAEQLVDEWLNRQGFFTVRGAKSGVHEIDLLGVRSLKGNKTELEAWHVEVQVSFNPIAYISKLDSDDMIEMNVRAKNSAKTRPTSRCGSYARRSFTNRPDGAVARSGA